MMTNDEDISGRYKRLFSTVVEGGYCIGCGICASLPMSPVKIELDLHGKFQPILLEPTNYSIDESIDPLEVCPFSEESTNEFEIGRELFGKYCSFHDKTGYFIDMYAGYVEEGAFRQAGSSGGMASWLLCELFQMNLIDGAIHVHSCGKTNGNQLLFNYSLSTCRVPDDCIDNRSRRLLESRQFMEDVMTTIRRRD